MLFSGCDVELGKQTFNLQMLGLETAAEGAAGDKSPRSLTYTLTGIRFVAANGGSDLALELPEAAKDFRIVARPQILYSQKLQDELVDSQYSHAVLTFDGAVKGEDPAGTAFEFTMATAALNSPEFTIKKSRDLNIIIKVKWKNTISADGVTEPAYDISVTH